MATFQTRYSIGQTVWYFNKLHLRLEQKTISGILIRSGKHNQIQYAFDEDKFLSTHNPNEMIGKQYDWYDEECVFEDYASAKERIEKILKSIQ